MAELLKDSRFGNIAKDPKFRSMPKSKRKIKIDKRFRSMLTNKEFCVTYKYDKRGRPVNQSSAENLRKYYGGSSDDDTDGNEDGQSQDDDDDSEHETDNKKIESHDSEKSKKLQEKNESQQSNKLKIDAKKKSKKKIEKTTEMKNEADSNENDSDDDDAVCEYEDDDNDDDDDNDKDEDNENKNEIKDKDSKTTQKLKDLSVDYARGHANLFSDDSSSSSEEEESESSDIENIVHNWGELGNDAEEIDEITTRLALCNMDWDRIRAVDIMALVISFLPPGGLVKSVTIYPTEFGLERMKNEELKGPIEITEGKQIEEDDLDTDDEDSKVQKEKIRMYQLKRLQYYFALIVLDSKESAETIYRALDGFEYESSSNKMDLRVVTDDRVFDQEPKEVCDKYPDSSNYKPRIFTTKAMQQVKCASTWDETSFERQEIAEKMNKGRVDEISHDDIAKYVATSSSEDEPENDNDNNLDQIKELDDIQSKKKNKNDISIYKLLLQQNAENEKRKKKSDIDFECQWGMRDEHDLKENTEKLVKQKLDQKEKEKLAPFDKYKLKIQEKKKEKKLKKKKLKNKTGNASDSEDSIPSDIDMNDPYFKEEMMNIKPNKTKNKKSKKNVVDSDDETKKQENAELELLLLDKEDEKLKNHFDMKKIEQNETLSKSKKKRLMKKNKGNKSEFEDKFEINVDDPRFTAVYDSPDFNIDPTDPHYRNTKGTELIRKEKFKRQGAKISNNNNNNNMIPVEEPPVKRSKNTKTLDDDVNALVRRIKSNTKNISKKIK